MDNFNPEERRTGIYRVCDPVKYFKIRVVLKRASSAPIGFDENAVPDGDNEQEIEMQKFQTVSSEEDDYVFTWNEKVFSQKELEFYADERLCTSSLDQKYHQEVMSERNNQRKTTRLFTFVDADIAEGKFQWEESVSSGKNQQSFLIEHMKGLRLRHRVQRLQNNRSESSVIPSKRIVQSTGGQLHFTLPSYQKMYIMADLARSERADVYDADEVVLCEITLDSNCVLMMNPDFSSSLQKPYSIRNKQNELFQYTLWNASQTMNEDDVESERSIWKKMHAYNSEILAKCIGSDFNMPTEKELKVFITGEIVSAQNFEYDGLFVKYKVELPEGWYSSSPISLSGTSQRCDVKMEEEHEMAYFGLPLEMELSCLVENQNRGEQNLNLSLWPKLYIQVHSLDFWGRVRTEGYTFTTFPSTPGTYTLTLSCWRPVEETCTEKMRRFFIGNTSIPEDLTYVGIPALESNQISKYGFQTQSSGEVLLHLNVAHQSLSFIHSGHRKKKKLVEWLRSGSGDSAVAGVLAAYQRTRQKMLQTRRELELQLSTT